METENKIFLIDDNPGDAILLREALKRVDNHIKFDAFQSGEDALNHLNHLKQEKKNELPNLVILDLNMPGMNGIEVLEVLKSDDCFKYLPVTIMTTSSISSDVENSYNAGANSVIVKPMDFDKYVEIIQLLVQYWFETAKTVKYD